MKEVLVHQRNLENEGKVFTKKKENSTIRKDYSPLSKDCNIYERGGLYMKEKIVISKEIKKNISWKSKLFVNMFPNTAIMLYRKGMVDCFKYYNKDGTF